MKSESKKEKMLVGVLFGGRSGEHEVSLMSAQSIIGALDPNKYTVVQIGITHEGNWVTGVDVLGEFLQGNSSNLRGACMLPDPTRKGLYSINLAEKGELLDLLSEIDVVFPVLHGTFGEDGTMQGLLEIADVAYVGSGVLGSSLGMDKAVFKDVMRANGIPVVDSITFTRFQVENNMMDVIERSEKIAPYPLFVKPVNLGSSVGIWKCHNPSQLEKGLIDAARYDRRVLVERGINAREIEVSVLGNDNPDASVPGEIIPADEFYSYDAKYHNDKSQLLIPAPISAEIVKKVQSFGVRSFCAIDCAGMARVDFLLDKDTHELYLNELNTIPGFTRISMYPKLWNASGVSYPHLVDRLIELALERKLEKDKTERRYYRS